MNKTSSLLLSIPVVLGLIGGCQAVLGIELLDEAKPDASVQPEAGVEAATDAAPEAADAPVLEASDEAPLVDANEAASSCDPKCSASGLARAVCRPTGADAPSREPLVYAIRTMRGGMDKTRPDDWKSLGLDLDCLSTDQNGQPPSCSTGGPQAQDGFEGRDNSLGNNIGGGVRSLLSNNIEVENNDGLERGLRGALFVIEDYNGLADDPKVTLTMLVSTGTRGDGGSVTAAWQGNDQWAISSKSLTEVQQIPRFVDKEAYVSGRVLVAHLPNGVPIIFNAQASDLVLRLYENVIQFKLSEDLKLATDGVIAGVWMDTDVNDSLTTFLRALGECPEKNPTLWYLLDSTIKNAMDIRLDAVPAPGAECRGISIGLGFAAEPAIRGPIEDPPLPVPAQCGD